MGKTLKHGRMPKVDLDALLTVEQCAAWLQMNPRVVGEKARTGDLPCHKIGTLVRFHPRTILAETRSPYLRQLRAKWKAKKS